MVPAVEGNGVGPLRLLYSGPTLPILAFLSLLVCPLAPADVICGHCGRSFGKVTSHLQEKTVVK